MLNTLRKLRHKSKTQGKEKSKKMQGKTKLEVMMSTSTAASCASSCSSFEMSDDNNPSRRQCYFSSVDDITSPMKHKRGSFSSRGSATSTCSAGSIRNKRLGEIAQLDRYIEHVKKSVDNDNISCIPNRLCCAQLLKSVLQRRERECMYEYLHSNRCVSESHLSMHSERVQSTPRSRLPSHHNDANDNRCPFTTESNANKVKTDLLNDNNSYRKVHFTSKSAPVDNHNCDFEDQETQERVPGALLSAYYDSDGTQFSDSDSEDYENHQNSHSGSKRKRRSIALFPQTLEIF